MGPTRKTPGTLVDSSVSVSSGAPARQPLAYRVRGRARGRVRGRGRVIRGRGEGR